MDQSEGGEEHRVEFKHYYRTLSAEMSLRHQRAIKTRTMRDRVQKVAVDHMALSEIYRSLILRVEGLLFQDAPCVEQNKDQWAPRVPLFIQLDAIAQIFRNSQRKN